MSPPRPAPDVAPPARDWLDAFEEDGYAVASGLFAPSLLDDARAAATEALDLMLGPAEFEADLGYPGAPASRTEAGGSTPRRLLNAASRASAFLSLATHPELRVRLQALLRTPEVLLSQCHHNCVMTKHPGYSSATLWHQDVRYWSFERRELISVWIALGAETERNGALQIVPGSHRLEIPAERLDRDLFLRPELPANAELLATARSVELEPGDALFFHCRALHAAGRNETERVKLSCVFTYHAVGNSPLAGTRSDRFPGIPLR